MGTIGIKAQITAASGEHPIPAFMISVDQLLREVKAEHHESD
jgi:hypothetical protein